MLILKYSPTVVRPISEKTCYLRLDSIALLKKEAPGVTVVVGGAVLTQAYADQIGADHYAPDAMATVRVAQRVLG